MIPLTPGHAEAAYDFLRKFGPFKRMGLPEGEAVEFNIQKRRDIFAEASYWLDDGPHIITLSSLKVGHADTLLMTVAHEMIHVYQHVHKTHTNGSEHNAEWHKIAKNVCRYFGWDVKAF